jgi:NADH-quinone oxidoreductase subunit L
MVISLVIFAIFSVIAGFVGVPAALGGGDQIERFLTPAAEALGEGARSTELLVMAASTGIALLGLLLAYLFYVAKPELPRQLAAKAHAAYSILENKYYVDELYDAIFVWPLVQASKEFLWQFVDEILIDGTVNGVGKLVRGTAGGLRRIQSGYVRAYAGWIFLGGVVLLVWFLR